VLDEHITNDFANTIGQRATGGGVVAGEMVRVNEDGMEHLRLDQSGEVLPIGDTRGGGGVVINVYQQPGEDGVELSRRLGQELVRLGMAKA